MLQAATVRSNEKFTRAVGRRMGETVHRQLNQVPKACWLFCAPLDGLEDLLSGVCEGAGTELVIGCTTAGEISNDGLSINSAVLAGVACDCIDFEIAVVQDLGKDSASAGRKLAQSFSAPPKYLQIFSDGLTGNGCAILEGIGSVLGVHTPVCGGAAGDNGNFKKTLLFSHGRMYTDALCGIAFRGDFQFGTGVRSGWAPIGLAKQVTRARGNVVYELNGEPALSVFERFLGQHARKLPAIGVEYPLGFMMPSGRPGQEDFFVLRASMSVDRKQRAIVFAGDIPEGVMVHMTCGDKASILHAAETAAKEARSAIGETTPEIVFCYSCMARKIVLGGRTEDGIKRVRAQIGSQVPIIGFYSYGEFCPVGPASPSYMHNETITLTVMGTGS